MPLTESQCLRSDDTGTTKDVKTYLDPGTGDHIQAIVLDDDSGNQAGIVTNPLHVQDATVGDTADAAITTDAVGTLSGKLRGLVAILADVWDSASHFLKVSIQNATLAVTQSGAWAVTTDVDVSNLATSAKQLPDGHNVTVDNPSIPVTGTFWQATQPVSAATLPLPSGAATAANQLPDGHNVTVDNASLAVTGTFWQATQPVEEQETPPTDASKNNPSYANTYVAGDLTQIDKTIGGTTYRMTLTYVAGDLTAVSAWAVV